MSLPMVVTLVAVGALLALVVVVAALALRDPGPKRRIEALFRKPRKPPKSPGQDHYYRPYWS
jgi:hypothetical protein